MEEESFYEDLGEEAEEEHSEDESTTIDLDDTPCILTHADAGKCLHTLGRCDSGYGYAYLSMNASEKGLTDVSVIPTFRHVIYVNVSGNKLTSEALRVLEAMTNLLMLQADQNCLVNAELQPMPYLQVLTMNKNKLTTTAGISHKLLECLELNYNNIHTVILDPETLENLKTLELRGNALNSTKGISCPSLVELYLAENQIKIIEGLDALVNLKTLHLRNNKLANLNGFHKSCRKLNYINLRNNEISNILELKKLNCLPDLKTLIILENPATERDDEEEEQKDYRQIVLGILPNLIRIDKDLVLDQERNEAKRFS